MSEYSSAVQPMLKILQAFWGHLRFDVYFRRLYYGELSV
jgi:hypothetical protein